MAQCVRRVWLCSVKWRGVGGPFSIQWLTVDPTYLATFIFNCKKGQLALSPLAVVLTRR